MKKETERVKSQEWAMIVDHSISIKRVKQFATIGSTKDTPT